MIRLCDRSTGPGPLTPELIRSILHAGTYTIPELQAALGVTDLVATVLSDRHEAAALVFAHNTEFNLRDRVVHVVEEAVRVEEFRRVAAADGTTFPDGPRLDRLGALMRSSHESCMALYECSHPELDALVAICEAAGAKGARLTGAGWGGCAVSLVHKSEVWAVVARVWQDFYVERCGLRADDTDTQRRCLFVSAPGAGARVRELL